MTVSSAQFSFVPRVNPTLSGGDDTPTGAGDLKRFGPTMGVAGREFTGTRSLAPIASGAFSSQDQALAFRHPGDNVLGAGAKNIGSWLFKSTD